MIPKGKIIRLEEVVTMNPITQDVARKLLLQSDAKYIAQEQPVIFYDTFSGALELETYICGECLIVKNDLDWVIHALSDKADIASAQSDVLMVRSANENLFAFSFGAPSQEFNGKIGSHKFARKGFPYEDPDIRKMTLEDRKKVEICCAIDPNDSQIGRNEAADFLRLFSDFCTAEDVYTLGLFESDKLVGWVKGEIMKELGFTTVSIYVNRAYRQKGYAKRLLSALCSTQQETVYCYSCVRTNEASAATAKACGFRYMGSYLKLD